MYAAQRHCTWLTLGIGLCGGVDAGSVVVVGQRVEGRAETIEGAVERSKLIKYRENIVDTAKA